METPVFALTRRRLAFGAGAFLSLGVRAEPAAAESAAPIEPQPYFAGVDRTVQNMAKLGAPLSAEDVQQISVLRRRNDLAAVDAAEGMLRRYTLADLSIASPWSARVTPGGAPRTLTEQGWRMFLLRIANPTGLRKQVDFQLGGRFPTQAGGNMEFTGGMSERAYLWDSLNYAPRIKRLWLLSQIYQAAPLSGIPIEYYVIQLFSRDAGRRSADFKVTTFPNSSHNYRNSGHGELDFNCLPSRVVTLGVLDENGRSCVASLTIKDRFDQVYPPQAMRLAPDLYFQKQVYRGDGETMRLADGEYTVEFKRGPEYLSCLQTVTIDAARNRIDLKLRRWIDPTKWGWYSGDPHIHAGGCSHYQMPTEGVSPETMIRQVRGEGLSMAEVLTWGPSWYYQKQFFTGHAESPAASLEHQDLQAANNASLQPHATSEDSTSTLRYDVEISGFPSSHAGHLMLLRLKNQDYPGARLIEDWPSWNLPILQWARAQEAVVGYAHCGHGLVVDSADLPNYEIPSFDDNGANEALVDVTHGLIDFLSGCDTLPTAELNLWYHLLNCGFRLALLGETDYPCISDERPGMGRTYVRLDRQPRGEAGYEAWIGGLQQGRLYCGDGRSHFLDFSANGRRSGDDLFLKVGETLQVEALVAARLEPEPPPDLEGLRRDQSSWRNAWHLEAARIGTTRTVAVELVVNGVAVDRTVLVADGAPKAIKFKAVVARSCWVALRIMPSAHTHPIFVQIGAKPIRASKRSAQWCRACVDKVWEVKAPFMRESERPAAAAAFDHAREAYDAIIGECEVA